MREAPGRLPGGSREVEGGLGKPHPCVVGVLGANICKAFLKSFSRSAFRGGSGRLREAPGGKGVPEEDVQLFKIFYSSCILFPAAFWEPSELLGSYAIVEGIEGLLGGSWGCCLGLREGQSCKTHHVVLYFRNQSFKIDDK